MEIEEDISDLDVDLTQLEGDVNVLTDQAVIHDERIFNLEQNINDIEGALEGSCVPL